MNRSAHGPVRATLFEKVWGAHAITSRGNSTLLAVDRHFLHDLGAARGLRRIRESGYSAKAPLQTFGTPDHAVASDRRLVDATSPLRRQLLEDMHSEMSAASIRLFDLHQPEHGIVHVIGPSQGLTLPGMTIVCGDSHTSTHGAFGAMGFGIGSSEVAHVLATQSIWQERPATMRIRFEGTRPKNVSAKDIILYAIGKLGTAGARGHAVEFAGSMIRAMSIDERLTICNMSIEMGAKVGMIAPDEKIFEYLASRPLSPKGSMFEKAVLQWRSLPSDDEATFDVERSLDCGHIAPQITWGTSPEHVMAVDATLPNPDVANSEGERKAILAALAYMGLRPQMKMLGVPVDWVFIGSCANGRLSDLIEAAQILKGRKVAPGIRAWAVPGSAEVKADAERLGLAGIFKEAGFEWRDPGCSLCLGANGEFVGPQQRCISTSNRNFAGRQGPGARTHLASAAMAAAAAVTGAIADPRMLG